MALYKFRVMFEEDENIFRDIEIKPSQSFIDFEAAIIKAWGLPAEAETSFYESNDRAQKVKSIPYRKTFKKDGKELHPVLLMFVNNPHQKFLYLHEGKQELTFFIELIQIGTEKAGVEYPQIVKSNGPSPVKKEDTYKHIKTLAMETEEAEGIDEDDEARLKDMGFEGEELADVADDEIETDTDADEQKEIDEDEIESADDEIGDMFSFDEGGEEDDRY
jgi:hypothetical protein